MSLPSGFKCKSEDLDCGCHLYAQTADEDWVQASGITYCMVEANEAHKREVGQKLENLKKSLKTLVYTPRPQNPLKSEISVKLPYPDIEICPACHGSGEVDAGIQWIDQYGEIRIRKNPFASEWILDPNPLVPLWSISICGICRGTGMNSLDIKKVS